MIHAYVMNTPINGYIRKDRLEYVIAAHNGAIFTRQQLCR